MPEILGGDSPTVNIVPREETREAPSREVYNLVARAKRACITRASQGQRDFLLAINLSSLVGVRLDVIQGSDLMDDVKVDTNQTR